MEWEVLVVGELNYLAEDFQAQMANTLEANITLKSSAFEFKDTRNYCCRCFIYWIKSFQQMPTADANPKWMAYFVENISIIITIVIVVFQMDFSAVFAE